MCCMLHSISTVYRSIHKIRAGLHRYIEDTRTTDFSLEKSSGTKDNQLNKGHNSVKNIEIQMPINLKTGAVQSLDVPDGESWMETDRSVFITQRIQDLVQAFHARAEKVKEKIAQPPTPSPSPPPENSSENDDGGPSADNKTRPRLQSLIHQEDSPSSDVEYLNESISLWCCKVQRKFVPTFPKVIDPQSKLYISWLFFVMLSYVYNAWVIVLRAVFHYQTSDNLPIFLVFDYIADIIYVIDIALFKVRLQFLHDGFWVDDPEKTRQNYFKKTMFKMDVLSLLPLDLLYFIYGVKPMFRISRLLKTQTFWEFFHRVDAVAKTPYVIRIIRTLLYMMYLIHLNACAYYAMSEWEGIGSNGWVFQGEGNAYIRCFYFATKTATSIGKNPKPENEYEYVFMTISWLMGVFIFAFLIGQIRDIVATATQSKTQYRQLMDQTVMYMRNLNLPEDLQRRVRLWLNHTWEQQKTLNESGILDSLPRKMKTDVAINVHYNTLVKVQLFKDCDKALLRDLVLQLKPVLFLPGDYICRKGEVGKEMYIVNKGLVQVTGGENSNIVLATLSEGSVFGEISLLGIPGCSRRTADVRSQGFSNLFVLGKDDLWEALKNYPEAQKVLRRKAKSLIKENEARDRANKNNNVMKVQPETIIKHSTRRASTPQLIKAVMQIVPKDSKCAQLLTRSAVEISKTSSTEFKSSKETGSNFPEPCQQSKEQTSPSSSLKEVKRMRSKIFSPQPDKKKYSDVTKPRSMSDVTLRNTNFSFRPESVKAVPNVVMPTSTVTTDSSLANAKQEEEQQKKSEDGTKALINTILNMLPSELYARRKNSVHPAKTSVEPQPKPNTNSEDSGISVDHSANQSLNQKLEDDSFSTCDSEDSSELSTTSTRRMAAEISKSPKTKDSSPQLLSSSSSILSLKALFRTGSSQSGSSTKTSKGSPVFQNSEVDEEQTSNKRPESLTSGSSSAGYDNLAFVPVDILSRRSSVFSDTSC